MPREQVSDSRLIPAAIPGVPDAWILHNAALEALLFDRNIVGARFGRLCTEASRHFLLHFQEELASTAQGGVAELLLLSKGYVYQLREAAADCLGMDLPVQFMAASRAAVTGTSVRVEVPYASLDSGARTLIIGDTVASGATVCAAIRRYVESYPLDRVLVFSIAGSLTGTRAIVEYCSRLGVRATVALGLAAFGLAENGFDLSFLHPDTVCTPEHRARALHAFRGKPVSVAGWDFGSQLVAPDKYRALCWVEERYWDLRGDDVFQLATPPATVGQIEREHAAFRERFPDLSALMQMAAAERQPSTASHPAEVIGETS